MVARLSSFSLWALDCLRVDVEVAVSPGLSRFDVIGLPDLGIRESRERVFQSLRHAGYEVPPGAITVNLAPAERKKRGAALDLPIALGILLASGQIRAAVDLPSFLVAGELSLDGGVVRVAGLFNAGLAFGAGLSGAMVPAANAPELAPVRGLRLHPVRHLRDAVDALRGAEPSGHVDALPEGAPEDPAVPDFSDLYGQDFAVRAAQIAVVSRLNLLFLGPPGCGKSLILRRLPGLLPPLSAAESMEVTRIHSAGGAVHGGLLTKPPFREVHPGISLAALVGGGGVPTPGEISLAHRGVLFLDELSEFPRAHLQALRVPLETGEVTVSRVQYQERFPCDFQLAAASNPCPCGHRGDPLRACRCSEHALREFGMRLSGPFLDRVDLILEVPPPEEGDIFQRRCRTTAELVGELSAARSFLEDHPGWISEERLGVLVETDEGIRRLVRQAYGAGLLSLRRVRSLLRVAATLALLENPGQAIREEHLLSALHFSRPKWDAADVRGR